MFALLFCVIDTSEEEEGWGGGERRTHGVLGKQAWLVLPCVSVPHDGLQRGGWQAVPFRGP